MTKKWEVTVNGTNNVIEYKAGFGAKILVNGQAYKVKSQNWFVMMVDYPITIDDTELRVVVIGNNTKDSHECCADQRTDQCRFAVLFVFVNKSCRKHKGYAQNKV